MAQIAYVDPWAVRLPDALPNRREVAYQVKLLDKQGQIVPLVATVNKYGTWSVDNSDYPYAVAQVWAARGNSRRFCANPFADIVSESWDTIIVTDSAE